MEIVIRSGTPSDGIRHTELYWVGPKNRAHDVAVRLDSRDNKWYVTKGLSAAMSVVSGPYETKNVAQVSAEMLWHTGFFTEREDT